MVEKDLGEEQIFPDFLNFKYEFLFRTIGKDGKFSTELKCFFLILLLSIPCLLMNYFTGTLTAYFISDWGYLVATILIGVFLWMLIGFQRRIDERAFKRMMEDLEKKSIHFQVKVKDLEEELEKIKAEKGR